MTQNSGKCYTYNYSFIIIKGCKSEPAKERDARARSGRVPNAKLLLSSRTYHTFPLVISSHSCLVGFPNFIIHISFIATEAKRGDKASMTGSCL